MVLKEIVELKVMIELKVKVVQKESMDYKENVEYLLQISVWLSDFVFQEFRKPEQCCYFFQDRSDFKELLKVFNP